MVEKWKGNQTSFTRFDRIPWVESESKDNNEMPKDWDFLRLGGIHFFKCEEYISDSFALKERFFQKGFLVHEEEGISVCTKTCLVRQ